MEKKKQRKMIITIDDQKEGEFFKKDAEFVIMATGETVGETTHSTVVIRGESSARELLLSLRKVNHAIYNHLADVHPATTRGKFWGFLMDDEIEGEEEAPTPDELTEVFMEELQNMVLRRLKEYKTSRQ